jgi:hypothetical protein
MTTGAPTQNMPKGPLFLRYATGYGVYYWPILARRTRVRVTTRYSEKFKINISSPPYSNETFYTKALNTRSISLLLT